MGSPRLLDWGSIASRILRRHVSSKSSKGRNLGYEGVPHGRDAYPFYDDNDIFSFLFFSQPVDAGIYFRWVYLGVLTCSYRSHSEVFTFGLLFYFSILLFGVSFLIFGISFCFGVGGFFFFLY